MSVSWEPPLTSCCLIFSQVPIKSRACWGGLLLPPGRSGSGRRSACPFPLSHVPGFSLVASAGGTRTGERTDPTWAAQEHFLGG